MRINDRLKTLCENEPDGTVDVLLTLSGDLEGADFDAPELLDIAELTPGVLKVRGTGRQILDLLRRGDIAEIDSDEIDRMW